MLFSDQIVGFMSHGVSEPYNINPWLQGFWGFEMSRVEGLGTISFGTLGFRYKLFAIQGLLDP